MRHRPSTFGRLSCLSLALGAGLTASAVAQGQFPPTDPLDNFTRIGQPLQQLSFRIGRAIGDPPPQPPQTPARGSGGTPERLYDNTGMDSLFIVEAQYPVAGDDGTLIARLPHPTGHGASVTSVEFGMYVNPGPNGGADFDAYVLFYDTLDPSGSPVNSDFVGGFFIEVRDIMGPIGYTTGPIDLTQIFPSGLALPDDDWFVEVRFYEPGGMTVASERATPMFSGAGVNIGSSEDIYWRDADENGVYDANDARFFGGPPHLANFYLAIDGVPNVASCPCDFNRDAIINSQDLFDFIVPFFAEDIAADFNADAVVNSQDFFDFLTCFFAGCP
jgi:hypothetical protein